MRTQRAKVIGAAAAVAIASMGPTAMAAVFTPSTSVDYQYIHGAFTITDSGSDVLTVAPGASITVSGTWSTTETDTSYCPDCIIQIYLSGLQPLVAQDNLAQGVGFVDSGDYTFTFTAPTTPGTYYVGGATTLQFGFITTFGNANGDGLVNYQINVVPEASTWAMLLLGFAGLGYAGYRRTARRALPLEAA